MLSQLEYIVLCPVILWAYFARSHGNIYQVIVTQKYSIIAFCPLWQMDMLHYVVHVINSFKRTIPILPVKKSWLECAQYVLNEIMKHELYKKFQLRLKWRLPLSMSWRFFAHILKDTEYKLVKIHIQFKNVMVCKCTKN